MKLTILIAVLLFCSCKKDHTEPDPTNTIEGTWRYVGYSGGFAGFRFTEVSPKIPYIQLSDSQLIITDATQYKCMQYQFQDQTADSVSLLRGLLTLSDTSYMMPNEGGQSFSAAIYNDTLALYPSQCADCFTSHYVRSIQQFNCSELH